MTQASSASGCSCNAHGAEPPDGAPVKTQAGNRDVILRPHSPRCSHSANSLQRFSTEDDFAFSAGPRTPLHYSRVKRLLAQAAKAAGVEPARSHDLRHTFASHLIVDLGLDVIQVQRQLGHARTRGRGLSRKEPRSCTS